MHSGIVFIGFLCTVSWVVQLLPVISVPVTGKSIGYNLYLSSANNIVFGVFGVCDVETDKCSSMRVGYPIELFLNDTETTDEGDGNGLSNILLPSNATYSVTKLLVVHFVSFIFTSLLLLTTSIFLLISLSDKVIDRHTTLSRFTDWLRGFKVAEQDDQGSVTFSLRKVKRSRRNITRYLNWMLLFSLLLFLLILLAFLADILLFVPKLSYLGWIQLLPIMLMSLISSLLCFMRRSISSRRHLEDEVYSRTYARGKTSEVRWVDDSDSDDGFYIYTNAFHGGTQRPNADSNIEMDETDIELHLMDSSSTLIR